MGRRHGSSSWEGWGRWGRGGRSAGVNRQVEHQSREKKTTQFQFSGASMSKFTRIDQEKKQQLRIKTKKRHRAKLFKDTYCDTAIISLFLFLYNLFKVCFVGVSVIFPNQEVRCVTTSCYFLCFLTKRDIRHHRRRRMWQTGCTFWDLNAESCVTIELEKKQEKPAECKMQPLTSCVML